MVVVVVEVAVFVLQYQLKRHQLTAVQLSARAQDSIALGGNPPLLLLLVLIAVSMCRISTSHDVFIY